MSKRDEVAIVGYAARLPGAVNVDAFWSLLRDNRSTVSWITPDRFPTGAFLHPGQEQLGRSYSFAAGVIDDPWGFDGEAFGMSPREAEQVDPQQRHLLEVSYDALAHAGIPPSKLAGMDVGVYVGASSVDHAVRFIVDPAIADVHMMTGNSLGIMANRISHSLDLRGPSLAVDTACSSSLVALNLAAEAIRSGTIDTAIVGGVNLLLSPFSYVGFSRASMLSPTGRCRPFDAAADGYVRSEGAIAVVLRSMAAARKSRNRIHAVIVGSAINQDGRTTGLSLPSADSQRALLEQVYSNFSVDPSDLAFVEAHGTGTPVGDPIEADALGRGLGQRRSQALRIGSVKSNIGHLEPVSGLAGLLKTVGALNQRVLPATLHQQSPNPRIPFDELNLQVVDRNWHLPDRRGAALAGVNSFGFGGTNAHVILRGGETTRTLPRPGGRPPPLLLSAHSGDALQALAKSYVEHWPADKRVVNEFISASAHQRDALQHRLIVRGGTGEELETHLVRFAEGQKSPAILTGAAVGSNLPVAFVFAGNGAQWVGMGRQAWHTNGKFRLALSEVDDHFSKIQGWSLVDLLFADDLAAKLRFATFGQPLLLAIQVATVRALEDFGVSPAAVVGHSVGEVAAAWAAGILSLEQAIDVVVARSRCQEAVRGAGSMAALMLSEREAHGFLERSRAQHVNIAAINSWRSVTIAGPTPEIERLVNAAAEARIGAKTLDLDYPFHSALVDPARAPLLRELAGLRPLTLRRPFVSSVYGEFVSEERLDADYWWQNVRQPVQFEAALDCLIQKGLRVFVEIGPKPILSSYMRDMLRQTDARGGVVETLTEAEAQKTTDPIELAACKVCLIGGNIKSELLFGPEPAMVMPLPPYPWQHSQFRLQPSAGANTALTTPTHPLLGLRPRTDCTEWFATIDPLLFPWLTDHKVGAIAVFPASGFVEVMLAAARDVYGATALELNELTIVRPLAFEGRASFDTSLRLSPETGVAEFYSRRRLIEADWTLHARAILRRSPITAKAATVPDPTAGTVIIPKARIYEKALELGYDYGPQFQRCQHVAFPMPKCAVATLETPALADFATHVSDLTGFDAAFHALFASEDAGEADIPMTCMLPVGFGCVRLFAPGAIASKVVARRLRQSPTSMVVDIDLLDDQNKIILSADRVRLRQAPTESTVDPRSLGYKLIACLDERPLAPSNVQLAAKVEPSAELLEAEAQIQEILLLLEAGCLRIAWNAFQEATVANVPTKDDRDDQGSTGWSPFLRSALLSHLAARGFATAGDREHSITETCELPDVASIVRSILARHPTMASEAASLSRIGEVLGQLLTSDLDDAVPLTNGRGRELRTSSAQVSFLKQVVLAEVRDSIDQYEIGRLIRLLMVGASHVASARELCEFFPNVEIIVTDRETEVLDRARATIGNDNDRLHFAAWSDLDEWPAGTIDLAFAIDALAELATKTGALAPIVRLLRPGAPMIAGELAPSLYWDIVRGVEPSWWARSATADFPVSALLGLPDWVDELQSMGFADASADPLVGNPQLGIILRGTASIGAALAEPPPAGVQVLRWQGATGTEDGALHRLRQRLEAGRLLSANDDIVTDVVWGVDAQVVLDVNRMRDLLAELAALCRHLAASPAHLSIVIDFGADEHETPALEHPLWCAVASAMRVAQNEYSDLHIRCLGIAGPPQSDLLDLVERELLAPTDEREVFFAGGRRWVFRIQRERLGPVGQERQKNMALTLTPKRVGNQTNLLWTAAQRREPDANEVEIEVVSTGLNYRDVMWHLHLLPEEALEDGYVGTNIGMECAGTVVRVGADVEELAPGDRVAAFASGAFSSHVIVPAFAVMRVPQDMSLEEATTLPVAFLTAYYSLVHLAHLGREQTVLIHGAAGGVGLAAIQVALHCGAKVIATAGTEEKRALLRNIGADLVCDSRSLGFAEEVLSYTKGTGVDVVLNSLAGEAMVRTLDCVKPFGRFVELGKRDFYANTHVGLKPLRRNVSYFAVDVDQLIGERKRVTQRLLLQVGNLLSRRELMPLPYRAFAGERAADAFQLMQRSGHIGKILVRPAARPSDQARGRFPIDQDGLHIVIGGTGGFGLATAIWLAERGARHLVLASRSGRLSEADLNEVETMRRDGVDVEITSIDVTDAPSLTEFVGGRAAHRPIKGIVHAAMVVDDGLIEGMDKDAIEAVLQPKVAGALNLEQVARNLPLDYLLFYSSATTLYGNPGQFNYVAANGFMEGLARRMRRRGVPALAVAWGGIEDVGYLSRHIGTNKELKKRFGSSLISSQIALDALDNVFDFDGRPTTEVCAIARIDWASARRELVALRLPTFGRVGGADGSLSSVDGAAIRDRLRSMAPDEAADVLLDMIVEEIGRVLRLPVKDIDRHRPLAEIGMDSLMMLELRTIVEASLQIELPMISVASGVTPADVAKRLASLLTTTAPKEGIPGTIVALSASHFAADAESATAEEQRAATSAVLAELKRIEGPL